MAATNNSRVSFSLTFYATTHTLSHIIKHVCISSSLHSVLGFSAFQNVTVVWTDMMTPIDRQHASRGDLSFPSRCHGDGRLEGDGQDELLMRAK